jgi:hypothetical protein
MALHPELEQPRARVDRRVVAACFASAVALTAASFASIAFFARTSPPPAVRTVALPMFVSVPVAAPAPIAAAPPADEPEPRVVVTRGQGDLQDPLPAAYHHTLTDEEADDLVKFVNTWVTQTPKRPESPPSIEYRRGVVFVETAEDRGDDGPYPRSAEPEAQLACGTTSTWLRSALLERLAFHDDIECFGNICTYPGMEYAPRGYFAFRPIMRDGYREWVLEAWVQTYVLSGDLWERSEHFVPAALGRLATTSCPGEPAGYY